MKSKVIVPLSLNDEQVQRLRSLQASFSEVCNALSPLVQKTRCWNRVGLHHLAYHAMRERFPQMGSQMICNAIYSVSRACRQVYQHPKSPWLVSKSPNKPLPRVKFSAEAPVFFDRHTLSLKAGQLSMFTLDGRIRFHVNMPPEAEERFVKDKLREVVLIYQDGHFRLSFVFGDQEGEDASETDSNLPQYLVVTAPLVGDVVEDDVLSQELDKRELHEV